jgi:phage tail protein X
MTACKSPRCGAEVMWLRNDHTGSAAPIDVTPNAEGNITVDRVAGTYHVLTKTEKVHHANPGMFDPKPAPLHTNHFMTCPDAEAFYAKRCKVCHYNPCRCAA